MAVTFANVTDVRISNGDVTKIVETSSGRVLWEKKEEEQPPVIRVYYNNVYLTPQQKAQGSFHTPATGGVLKATYYFTPENQSPYEVDATDVVWKIGSWLNTLGHNDMLAYGSSTMTLSATTGASVTLTKVDLSSVPASDSLTQPRCTITCVSTTYKDPNGALPYPYYTETYARGGTIFGK